MVTVEEGLNWKNSIMLRDERFSCDSDRTWWRSGSGGSHQHPLHPLQEMEDTYLDIVWVNEYISI